MQIEWSDFNGSEREAAERFAVQWGELEAVLRALPLHLKASDQAGITGKPIFDPVGTNEHLRDKLKALGWQCGIPIPTAIKLLGTNVDCGKGGLLLEIQFSNYPFLLNNGIRSELFVKSRIPLTGAPTGLVVIITKAQMFPASNSTLYYEQAFGQLDLLTQNDVFDAPIRLVGLFETTGVVVPVRYTTYHAARYSRTVVTREDRRCEIIPVRPSHSRCTLRIL